MLSRRQSFTSATAYSATAARRFGGGRGRRTRPRAPLTTELYAADPSAHFFGDRIFVYCSHDSPEVNNSLEVPNFNMVDFHVLELPPRGVSTPVVTHPVALRLADVPWARGKMWAPDAAYSAGRYYLYFSAQDAAGVFRIGVAQSARPQGPFAAQPQPMANSFSVDPAVFRDGFSNYYLFFGGLCGGQLQRWESGSFDASASGGRLDVPRWNPETRVCRDANLKLRSNLSAAVLDAPAVLPRYARLTDDMLELAHEPRRVEIVDEAGAPLRTGDHERRFFEGAWVHARRGVYYLSWSTGSTHRIVYATASSVHGPWVYRGVVSHPVKGWTHHHSIVEVGSDEWLFFYHDTERSDTTHLRDAKVAPLRHHANGSIEPIFHHGVGWRSMYRHAGQQLSGGYRA